MAKFDNSVKNAALDAIANAIGGSPVLLIYTGAEPELTTSAATGVVLVRIVAPTVWANAASNGEKTIIGPWNTTSIGTGIASYYRLYNTNETICMEQGSVGISLPSDMILDNTNIRSGQAVSIISKTLSFG